KLISRLRVVFHVRRFVPFLFDFFTSKEVSIKKKILSVAFLVGYVAMPLDLIPDFLPFIGILDDIGIVLFILNRIVKMAPVQLQEKHNVNVG
ncbi:DUF1232 domain-containing protein, partial [Bacillus cereus]